MVFVMLAPLLLLCFGVAAGRPDVELGRPAPELPVKLPDGRTLRLSGYRGKVVALSFIYTTCAHCRRTSQTMNRLGKEYGPRGFRPLGVAFDANAAGLLPAFLKEAGIQYPVAIGTAMDLFDFLDIPPQDIDLPQIVFIDRKGIIRKYFNGPDAFPDGEEKTLRAWIEKLLSEQPPGGERKARQ